MMASGKWARWACMASLACAAAASAQTATPTDASSASQPASAPAAAPRKPLMDVLDHTGLGKGLDDLNVNIYGFVESSATFNAQGTRINEGGVFDTESREFDFNQADLTFERTVDPSKGKFDVGGRMEWIWGSDAAFIHSNGLFDWYNGPENPDEQWDPVQAYVDFALPIGSGLDLKVGKFVTLLGYETINPTNNPFYSHSYLFGFAIPFTHTGVLATYVLNPQWTISAGVTRGWEQAFKDNNRAPDFLGSVTWAPNEKWKFALNNTTGAEQANDSRDLRTVFDLVATYTVNEKLTLGFNGDYGFESNSATARIPGNDAQWYGIATYLSQKLCDAATVNVRGEWFDDTDGSRGLGTNVYEVTLGLTITPFYKDNTLSNFKLRPEVRWDYGQTPLFDTGTRHDQFTAAIEGYFTF